MVLRHPLIFLEMNILLISQTVVTLFLMSFFIVLIAVRFLPAERHKVEEN